MSLTLTQNLSLTFDSSADARIDFMFNAVEGSSLERTCDLLEKSWKQSPIDTLKLLFYTRDIRRGKGCRAQFLLCLKWIYDKQFDSLLKILEFFPEYGCYKDYFNLLLIALFDEVPYDADESVQAKLPADLVSKYDRIILRGLDKDIKKSFNQMVSEVYQVKRKQIKRDPDLDKKVSIKTCLNRQEIIKTIDKPMTKNELKEYMIQKTSDGNRPKKNKIVSKNDGFFKFKTDKKKLQRLIGFRKDFLENKLKNDEKFAKLYNIIVERITDQLERDWALFKNGSKSVSLLAKWFPNRGKQFDKYLFIQLPIAKRLFRRLNIGDPDFQNKKQLVFEFEKFMTKLRRIIEIPEIPMSEKHWNDIVYNRVTSKALFRYKSCFTREDFNRYSEFISTSKTVKGGALTPAELIREVLRVSQKEIYNIVNFENMELDEQTKLELSTLDKQWISLIEDVKKKGALLLKDTLAICDVSGSMMTTNQAIQPIFGAIGLTLLLMHFTEGLWAQKCIAFSEQPKMFQIDTSKPLLDQVRDILKIDAGLSTDLNLVFKLILKKAKEAKLPQEKMPRVLFVFSDMEFNMAFPGFTNFEVAQLQFSSAGYEMPLIVFWNLNGDKSQRSTPVKCDQNGVVLLSGYSAQTLNFFTCEDFEQVSPKTMLNKILQDERYAQIQ